MRRLILVTTILSLAALPSFTQTNSDVKAEILKHLKKSEEFTVKVAEAMPEADYSFKLTKDQMSFAGQLDHLSNALLGILSPMTGSQDQGSGPKPTSKAEVIKLIHSSFAMAISEVSQLTPAQLAKSYSFEGGSSTGLGLLLLAMDHTTHHRASAEMYLRAKGIVPPEYEF